MAAPASLDNINRLFLRTNGIEMSDAAGEVKWATKTPALRRIGQRVRGMVSDTVVHDIYVAIWHNSGQYNPPVRAEGNNGERRDSTRASQRDEWMAIRRNRKATNAYIVANN